MLVIGKALILFKDDLLDEEKYSKEKWDFIHYNHFKYKCVFNMHVNILNVVIFIDADRDFVYVVKSDSGVTGPIKVAKDG